MGKIYLSEESYQIIGVCMEVHNNLGAGFSEIVYKEALEIELRNLNVPFEREKQYSVNYKNAILNHKFYADFVVFDEIILEIKAVSIISNEFVAQSLNYLKVSNNKLALLVNFGEFKLNYKRIIL